MADKIRLNIGAGESNLPGFIPLDIQTGTDASERLDYQDDSVDEVYSSHTLEHIHGSKTFSTIREWVRVLKPGGRIRICIPDFDGIIDEYRSGHMSIEQFSAWMHGGKLQETDRHLAVLNEEALTRHLRMCGVDDLRSFDPDQPDCSTDPVVRPRSINIEGFKRQVVIPRDPRVAMVLSVPRLGFNDMFTGAIETAKSLGWGYMLSGGTEWGKGLTQAVMEMLQKEQPDYIMCLDYDSVFTAQDAKDLLKIMQEHPEIGAVYPVEAHRHGDVPLGFATDGDVIYGGDITEVGSGHFGCTIIRRQVFEKLPQPWFISLPDPATGLWSKNNIDADITFWAAMALHGFRVAQANNVQIGHMELCVKWVKPDGIIWQPIQNYRAKGKPANAKFDAEYWNSKNQSNRRRVAARDAAANPPIHPPQPRPPEGSPELENPPPALPGTVQYDPVDAALGGRMAPPPGAGMYRAPIQTFPNSAIYKPQPALNGQE